MSMKTETLLKIIIALLVLITAFAGILEYFINTRAIANAAADDVQLLKKKQESNYAKLLKELECMKETMKQVQIDSAITRTKVEAMENR